MSVIGIAAFSGVASAHPPEEIRFCGCSQVCVSTDDDSFSIFYAIEGDDGYTCRVEPNPDEGTKLEGCYTAGDDEKIIGVLGGARNFYHNPNTCAKKALRALDLNECLGCDDCVGNEVTYEQVGKHEYEVDVTYQGVTHGVVIRTRLCKPPSEWDDDPAGPPEQASGRGRGR